MTEKLFEFSGVTVTVTGVYGTLSVIVLLLFMTWWLLNRKKRTGQPIFAGQVMNGIGFGLLPALAFLKAFQDISMGKGAAVTEPLPLVRWLTEDGCYRPMRIETAAAICTWIYKSFIPVIIYASTILILFGLCTMYLAGEKALVPDRKHAQTEGEK